MKVGRPQITLLASDHSEKAPPWDHALSQNYCSYLTSRACSPQPVLYLPIDCFTFRLHYRGKFRACGRGGKGVPSEVHNVTSAVALARLQRAYLAVKVTGKSQNFLAQDPGKPSRGSRSSVAKVPGFTPRLLKHVSRNCHPSSPGAG
eukprot:1145691-Pelagomonas_calceolata.AAC.1